MKSLIVLVVGLLSVGCATLKDRVAGEYEFKDWFGATIKKVFLEDGVYEWYANGKKQEEFKWSISNGEIHVVNDSGFINVYRINQDKSITLIEQIGDGGRTDFSKYNQPIWKKIK